MSLINLFQQANVDIDNQQLKDNLLREQVIKGLLKDVQAKEEQIKQVQADKAKTIQEISPTSKG